MICFGCLDDVPDVTIAYERGDILVCSSCWPTIGQRILKQAAYYESIGHTGSDMCGCSMCAAKADLR